MNHRFKQVVEPYLDELKKYCRLVAVTPWDAEDLFQETMLKVHRNIRYFENADNIKSYLFRTVTNTWIDHCRRNKIQFEQFEDDNQAVTIEDRLEVEDALEQLVCELPPLQSVVFLLSDVFHFTLLETAKMINSNENAVKSALFRARRNIRSLSWKNANKSVTDQSLLEVFIQAFRKNDPLVIGRAYRALVAKGFAVQRTFTHRKPYFVITDPDGNKFIIS